MSIDAPAVTAELDLIEFAACEDMWASADAATIRDLGLVRDRVGDLRITGCRACPDVAMLNRVMGTGHATFDPGALAAAVRVLTDRGCVSQVTVRDDDPAGTEARAWLIAHGFETGYGWMKFVHAAGRTAASRAEPSQVSVHACTSADRGDFGRVFAVGFDLPSAFGDLAAGLIGRRGWSCFVANAPGMGAIGAGALFVDGDAGWLGLAATLPAARGLGAQTALIRERIAEARRLGCRMVVTETGERVPDRPSGSYRNLLRAGFRERGVRPNLLLRPGPTGP